MDDQHDYYYTRSEYRWQIVVDLFGTFEEIEAQDGSDLVEEMVDYAIAEDPHHNYTDLITSTVLVSEQPVEVSDGVWIGYCNHGWTNCDGHHFYDSCWEALIALPDFPQEVNE